MLLYSRVLSQNWKKKKLRLQFSFLIAQRCLINLDVIYLRNELVNEAT